MPKLSVIIPVYNVEKYLSQALESVINQTFADIEIICINDGSTDNSLTILENYAQKDQRIKLINKQNAGYGAACNDGLSLAQGEFIAILEPDDYIKPDMYENLLNLIQKNDADIAKCTFSEVLEYKKPPQIQTISWAKNFDLPVTVFNIYQHPEFLYFHPSIWSCIYKTAFLKENNIKFITPKGAGWADNLFQVQTMCLAKKIIYTDEPYYNYRKYYFSESDALKDYTIPFERSKEIHKWLNEQNISDENLLACLYKRELTYVHLMLSSIPFSQLHKGIETVKSFVSSMDKNIILKSSVFNSREKAFYKLTVAMPFIAYLKEKIKKIRKSILCVHINRNESNINILGRQIKNA